MVSQVPCSQPGHAVVNSAPSSQRENQSPWLPCTSEAQHGGGAMMGFSCPPRTPDSLGCPISIEQCPFVLGLSAENSELILHECVQLTQDMKTKERHLFLFSDMLIIAKLKSGTSFRLKHRVDLCELWAVACGEDEEEEEEARELHVNPRYSIILVWPSSVCLASFRSLDVKELWLDTLVWQIKEIRRADPTGVPSTRVLMKVLTSCNASKTLSPGNMEAFECHTEAEIRRFPFLGPHFGDDGICHLIESSKKRRKVLSWPFPLRRGSALTSESSDALDGVLKATLFDQPLAIVCDEDSLPKPIMDILTILCLKGPFVEGIFRKNANEKARKELKEELNSGRAVDLESKPVHLLAVVFKDFLRSIPHMLLSSDLYPQWMEALEKQNMSEQIEDIKKVADKLPRPNLLLLRHLMCVLHHISQQARINKMDASNLAICIGPNLLNPDQKGSQPLEVQKLLNDKVKALVEFFIENCFDIFGDDLSLLLCTPGEDSLEQAVRTELSSTQQNDSAYDSTGPDAEGLCSPTNQQAQQHCRCGHFGSAERMCQAHPHSGPSPITGRSSESCIGKLDRRSSEPNLFLSPTDLEQSMTRQKLTKSHDDVTAGPNALDFEVQGQENGSEEDNFLTCRYKNKKPLSLMVNTREQLGLSLPKTPSSCSLDSSCSNSDSSVFTYSPQVSPSSPKRLFFPRHESFSAKKCLEGNKVLPVNRQLKKHSLSFTFLSHKKALTKTQSWEPDQRSKTLSRSNLKNDFENGTPRTCDVVRESSVDELAFCTPCQSRARLMSADEVFRLVDQKNPGKPPSYEEAIQRSVSAKLPSYRSLTVQTLRSSVMSQDPLLPHSVHKDSVEHSVRDLHAASPQSRPCVRNTAQGPSAVPTPAEEAHARGILTAKFPGYLPRTMSETQLQSRQECFVRRCSQPLFEGYEQIQYAKESYV
ncbi:T-cell activation Rho GTPase-activating protein isoform X4 [Ambystoma mexicanum]|uniref:T-cell activation Rho GTPase-activating protein isoform X4 n=1 Tax=Ambystoma mexicanum TaxID=8296 RepID=UPI0037E90356